MPVGVHVEALIDDGIAVVVHAVADLRQADVDHRVEVDAVVPSRDGRSEPVPVRVDAVDAVAVVVDPVADLVRPGRAPQRIGVVAVALAGRDSVAVVIPAPCPVVGVVAVTAREVAIAVPVDLVRRRGAVAVVVDAVAELGGARVDARVGVVAVARARREAVAVAIVGTAGRIGVVTVAGAGRVAVQVEVPGAEGGVGVVAVASARREAVAVTVGLVDRGHAIAVGVASIADLREPGAPPVVEVVAVLIAGRRHAVGAAGVGAVTVPIQQVGGGGSVVAVSRNDRGVTALQSRAQIGAHAGSVPVGVCREEPLVDLAVAVVVHAVQPLGRTAVGGGVAVVTVVHASAEAVSVRVGAEERIHDLVAVLVDVVAAGVRGPRVDVGGVVVAIMELVGAGNVAREAVAVGVDAVHWAHAGALVTVLVDAVPEDVLRARVDARVLRIAVERIRDAIAVEVGCDVAGGQRQEDEEERQACSHVRLPPG